ncbi:MAG TPA: nuclear transport factor 2 family protein [Mycobacteriales bacterium]|nr:nuclear transport factor 2 family protein [Mycobacteriales bacterium]
MPTSHTDDVVAIGRLQAAYADVVTRRAWAELGELFLPSAQVIVDTVTAPPVSLDGPDELGAFIGGAVERFDHFQFVILNAAIDLATDGDPDSARGRIFMCEIRHTTSGEWSTAYGLYQDDYRREDGAWKIAGRRYRSLARTGANEGVFGIPTDLPPFSR